MGGILTLHPYHLPALLLPHLLHLLLYSPALSPFLCVFCVRPVSRGFALLHQNCQHRALQCSTFHQPFRPLGCGEKRSRWVMDWSEQKINHLSIRSIRSLRLVGDKVSPRLNVLESGHPGSLRDAIPCHHLIHPIKELPRLFHAHNVAVVVEFVCIVKLGDDLGEHHLVIGHLCGKLLETFLLFSCAESLLRNNQIF